ncbi:MAG: hypothetical protein EP329_15865 [Deltaproteobacteria bacterium]|nr:MAG: hypothetical protein EP329_15865 [Deltaproteobacteria bacterium]
MRLAPALPLFALLVLSPACSGDTVADLVSATKTIGATGGSIELPGGVGLSIPAGALSGDVQVGAEVVSDLAGAGLEALPDYLAGTPAVSVALTPHGTTFDAPVTLALPLPAELAADPGNLVAMRLASPEATEWEPVGPIRFVDGKATLEITHFSVYTVVQAGTCPCWNGSNLRSFYAYGENLVQTGGWLRTLSHHQDDGTMMPGWSHDRLQVNYFPPGQGYSQGQLSAFSSESSSFSGYTCSARARSGYYDFLGGFPATGQITSDVLGNNVALLTKAEFLVCKALLLASETGPPAHEIGVAATGLPAGEALELAQGAETFTVPADDAVVFAPQVVAEGEAYAITIATQPASVTCTLDASAAGTMGSENVRVTATCAVPQEVCNGLDDDHDGATDEGFDVDEDGVTTCGPDGVAGNADDDCNDGDGRAYPGAAERCNGEDDDCDGAPLAGETSDGDSDGVPDACDAHPSDGCPRFDVAWVLEVKAATGGSCYVDAASADLPSPLDTELDRFTGAFVAYNADNWEAVGVGILGTDLFAIAGCYQDVATGYCTDNGRTLLPAGSEADQAMYDACGDVAQYACEL